jgi:hypothetical protein
MKIGVTPPCWRLQGETSRFQGGWRQPQTVRMQKSSAEAPAKARFFILLLLVSFTLQQNNLTNSLYALFQPKRRELLEAELRVQ